MVRSALAPCYRALAPVLVEAGPLVDALKEARARGSTVIMLVGWRGCGKALVRIACSGCSWPPTRQPYSSLQGCVPARVCLDLNPSTTTNLSAPCLFACSQPRTELGTAVAAAANVQPVPGTPNIPNPYPATALPGGDAVRWRMMCTHHLSWLLSILQ